MHIITCPQCRKKVYNLAPRCKYCGYTFPVTPVQKMCIIGDEMFDFNSVHTLIDSGCYDFETVMKSVVEAVGVDNFKDLPGFSVYDLTKTIVETKAVPRSFSAGTRRSSYGYTLRCPKCGSASITSGLPFNLFGSKKISYRCRGCGYSWKI